MTIKELIKELEQYPPETPVMLDNGDGLVNIDEVEWENYYGYIRKVVIK
jgi:hypothetical protein